MLGYQGAKLAGSFFYLFKLGVFKLRIERYKENRMDQLAQHQDFLQNRGTEIDMRPEGEHEDEGDGSQDDHSGEQED